MFFIRRHQCCSKGDSFYGFSRQIVRPQLIEKGGEQIQYRDYRYEISKEFHSIYAMQVRRLGYEYGAVYSEDHGKPILTLGDRSVIFCLGLNNGFDGTIFQNKESKLNKEVYVFQWSVTSLFHYNEFRSHARWFFPAYKGRPRLYPQFELPQTLCNELLETHRLLLDGNLEKEDSYHFYYWIVDKGHGLFGLCINTYFDALLFLPVNIVVKETGKNLRW